jgi:hypothetical protein
MGVACAACGSNERCEDQQCVFLETDAGTVDAGPVRCRCETSCCLPDGTCAPNNDPAACGAPKVFCGQCEPGRRCELGVCVATACNGCFDPLGICRPGTSDLACGSDGGVCLACGADQACRLQVCRFTRCDAANCRFGCCRADLSCELSPGPLACGLSGSPCVACVGTEQCVGGQCL